MSEKDLARYLLVYSVPCDEGRGCETLTEEFRCKPDEAVNTAAAFLAQDYRQRLNAKADLLVYLPVDAEGLANIANLDAKAMYHKWLKETA